MSPRFNSSLFNALTLRSSPRNLRSLDLRANHGIGCEVEIRDPVHYRQFRSRGISRYAPYALPAFRGAASLHEPPHLADQARQLLESRQRSLSPRNYPSWMLM